MQHNEQKCSDCNHEHKKDDGTCTCGCHVLHSRHPMYKDKDGDEHSKDTAGENKKK